MEILSNIGLGFETAFTPVNLLYCFVGVLVGTLIGVLPGLGPVATIAMLLPMTFGLDPVSALIMLAGIFYGAQYGGSTTAILINVPGESSSVVTALDGHRMAVAGRAGIALGAAAISSFLAGTVAALVIALLAPPLAEVALMFGSAEYFSLTVLGLVVAVTLAGGSVLKSIAMVVTGLMLGLVGTDVNSGAQRYTLGFPELHEGINFVVLAMGTFGIAEVMQNVRDEATRQRITSHIKGLIPSRQELRRMVGAASRGTMLGIPLGILPGGGALLSSFASYALEKRISREPEKFGTGAIEGVAGPEAANNAGAQTSFIPMLTLGLPSNPVMALMIGAMIIHGIQPGPNIVSEQPTLFWGLIVSMWIGNIMLVVLNLPLVGLWARLITVPYHLLFPLIVAFTCVGVFALSRSTFDVFLLAVFGLFGYVAAKLKCEVAPLLLGFILGPMMEEHLRRALLLSRGDPLVFVEQPISAALLVLAVLTMTSLAFGTVRRYRAESMGEGLDS